MTEEAGAGKRKEGHEKKRELDGGRRLQKGQTLRERI